MFRISTTQTISVISQREQRLWRGPFMSRNTSGHDEILAQSESIFFFLGRVQPFLRLTRNS